MIVLPMAGRSSRFFKAGYKKPKFELAVTESLSVFDCILYGYKEHFDTETFLIICLAEASSFVEARLSAVGIKDYNISILEEVTRGQAETVYLGLKRQSVARDESILIFNIDTFRPQYKFPDFRTKCDGYLEVFVGNGDNWSYAKTDEHGWVTQTTEKVPISNYCSTGGYYFSAAGDFMEAYEDSIANEITTLGEYYVAPMYNYLIERGKMFKVDIVNREEVIFCGVPAEYENLDKSALLDALDIAD